MPGFASHPVWPDRMRLLMTPLAVHRLPKTWGYLCDGNDRSRDWQPARTLRVDSTTMQRVSSP